MLRAAAVLCVLELWGCSDGTYVIGRHRDAGPRADAAADAGRSPCEGVHAGAVVCNGFEADDLESEWEGVRVVNDGELERSTERAYSGEASLRAATSAGMSAAIVVQTFAPVASGELHLRAHVFVAANQPTEIMNLFFLGVDPEPDPFIGVDFNLEDGALQVFSPQADPARQTADTTVPRDRWFCFRARITIEDDGEIDLYVDDALALHATGIDTLEGEGVTELRAGIDWSSAQSERFEVYIDDLVLDTAEVPCAP
jgi:hypothetical protein